MVKDLVVIGSGGLDIVRLIEDINSDSNEFNFIGFLEKDQSKIGQEVLGYPILGTDDLLINKFSHCCVVNNVIQTTKIHEIVTKNLREIYHVNNFPNLIHPTSKYVYFGIGEGNIIYEHVTFGAASSIGNFNILYPNTSIGHETKVGDSNLLALNVNIGARSEIGNRNLFGNASVVSLGLQIGDDNQLGVGSVLIDNLGCNSSLLGNPAIDSIKALKEYIKKNTAVQRKNLRHILN